MSFGWLDLSPPQRSNATVAHLLRNREDILVQNVRVVR